MNTRDRSPSSDVFGRKRKRDFHEAVNDGNTTTIDAVHSPSGKKVNIAQTTDDRPKQVVAVSQILRGVNVADYAEARALEIANTIEALKEAAALEGKRIFQRLPRHMRRRAASYDRRRIPRNMRKKAAQEVV